MYTMFLFWTIWRKLLSKESIKRYLLDYCDNTTIHGFKYVGESGRPRIERIWWMFVFGLSVAGSSYLINKAWHKWHDSPIIVSFSDRLTPVWQIPFPTVTICSETKARQSVFNFTYAMFSTNLTNDERKKRDDISLICDSQLDANGSRYTNESTIDTIYELAPQFDEMMWLCTWKMQAVKCNSLFIPVLTEEGVCFSFNILFPMEMYRDTVVQSESDLDLDEMLTKPDWNLEEGYDKSCSLETEPRRALGAGAQAGIKFVLRAFDYDLDYTCGPVQGFKILLHNPAEIPRLSERYFRVPHDQELVLSVKPNMMTTREDLRSYQPSTRQCYFPSERQLANFKIYTQRNCELECLTNYTLKKCQCAAIYMPRLESTQLCGAGSKTCMHDAREELKIEEIMLSIEKTQNPRNTCDCLPACISLQYDAETSQTDFSWYKTVQAYQENITEYEGMQITRVTIYFKDDQFIASVRSELYSVADFLAICGGLLGLFSGVSVLSLIEIIYYITLRFYSSVRPQNIQIDDTADGHSHSDMFKIDPNETKNYDRLTVTSYRCQH